MNNPRKIDSVKELLRSSGLNTNSFENRFPYTYHHDYRRIHCPVSTSRADEAQRQANVQDDEELLYLGLMGLVREEPNEVVRILSGEDNAEVREIFKKACEFVKVYEVKYDPDEYGKVLA